MFKRIDNIQFFQRHPSLYEFAKFSVVGLTGTVIDFGVYTLLTRGVGLYYIDATAISVFLAILNNFFLNKYWTFQQGQSGRGRIEYGKFLLVSTVNYFLNVGITYAVVEYTHAERLFGSGEDFFAKAVAISLVLFSNFFGNKFWTFRPTERE